MSFNSLRPRQNGRHFPDDIFKWIFVNGNIWISINISLKFVHKGLINNTPALVLIMAWRRPGDKPLSEPMLVISLTHICVTWPQWVKDKCMYPKLYEQVPYIPKNDIHISLWRVLLWFGICNSYWSWMGMANALSVDFSVREISLLQKYLLDYWNHIHKSNPHHKDAYLALGLCNCPNACETTLQNMENKPHVWVSCYNITRIKQSTRKVWAYFTGVLCVFCCKFAQRY